jgi:hypothetical protein
VYFYAKCVLLVSLCICLSAHRVLVFPCSEELAVTGYDPASHYYSYNEFDFSALRVATTLHMGTVLQEQAALKVSLLCLSVGLVFLCVCHVVTVVVCASARVLVSPHLLTCVLCIP